MAAVSVGQTVQSGAAQYEVVGLIGQGAMGDVYRGRHVSLDRPVAIKVLKPGSSPERFLREARLAARVNSPHTVTIYDSIVLEDGSRIIVMEYINGRSLLDIIKADGEAGLPLTDLARHMNQAAIGMAATSAAGIVHRDLKPANLLIDVNGRLRIGDFGIARIDVEVEPDTVSITMPGIVFGTPLYMAPEQSENPSGVDVRSDIYSYGATFYHAATGVPPFDGLSVLDVLFKHKYKTPAAPRARRTDLPSQLNDVIERCLAKTPGDRFQTFEDVREALGDPASEPWETRIDPRLEALMSRYRADARRFWSENADGELARYDFPGGRSLRIVRGDIADARADAIVSSDDELLSMGGGVSAALNGRSGFVLSEEVRKFGPIRHGGVVVTGAGQLNARFVLHGVTIDYQGDSVLFPSRDVLLQIMSGCFYHADTLRLKSLAFPLLGTGSAGFSRETCLDTMVGFLAKALLLGGHSVDSVQIVLVQKPSSE